MLILFLQSVIIGLAIAAPVGPIGIICIRTTIAHGVLPGLAVGLGAAVADAMYALAAGLGLAAITKFLLDISPILKFGGGIFLLYLGTTFFLKKTHYSTTQSTYKKTIGKTFVTTFFLTLTNPMTMLSFLGIMSALEVEATSKQDVATLIIGVLIGSALWWLFLVTAVSLTAKRLSEKILNYINRFSGIIIIAFALYILIWA